MKIKDVLYETPEMTEEKLLEIMESHEDWLEKDFIKRISYLHKEEPLNKALLKEYDLIQDKESYLTKGQRNKVIGFVSTCMILMAKGDGRESASNNRLESIPEAEEIRDNSN